MVEISTSVNDITKLLESLNPGKQMAPMAFPAVGSKRARSCTHTTVPKITTNKRNSCDMKVFKKVDRSPAANYRPIYLAHMHLL